MEHLFHRLLAAVQILGAILWGIVCLGMFASIAIAVVHGWNPSGYPSFVP